MCIVPNSGKFPCVYIYFFYVLLSKFHFMFWISYIFSQVCCFLLMKRRKSLVILYQWVILYHIPFFFPLHFIKLADIINHKCDKIQVLIPKEIWIYFKYLLIMSFFFLQLFSKMNFLQLFKNILLLITILLKKDVRKKLPQNVNI